MPSVWHTSLLLALRQSLMPCCTLADCSPLRAQVGPSGADRAGHLVGLLGGFGAPVCTSSAGRTLPLSVGSEASLLLCRPCYICAVLLSREVVGGTQHAHNYMPFEDITPAFHIIHLCVFLPVVVADDNTTKRLRHYTLQAPRACSSNIFAVRF